MKGLYPLKFEPILKERIWGGDKLHRLYGKASSIEGCIGESWELSVIEGDVSVVSNGFLAGNTLEELIEIYMGDLVGEKVYNKYGIEFPLLIKLIDASEDLSVQVHPNDILAKERHHAWGKSEFWYILECENNSEVVAGFKKSITPEEFTNAIKSGDLSNLLKHHRVSKGDSIYIPAGLIHTIGKGVVLAEIQQTSDVTYRIFDWNRKDKNGESRELHTELALGAIDYKSRQDIVPGKKLMPNIPDQINSNPYFTVNRLLVTTVNEISSFHFDSFRIYICIEGNLHLKYLDNQIVELKKGEVLLIPAELNNYFLEPKGETTLLEIFVT